MGSNGAVTDDYGCPGSVGEKIKYLSGGTYWISGISWKADFVTRYHSGTVGYEVFH